MTRNSTTRQKWLAILAKLCSPGDPVAAGEAFAAMLPMLADFPDGAFCERSLQFVACRAKRLPSYAELRSWIAEWWKGNRPATPALPDDTTGLTAEDRSWLARWHKREAEGFQPAREPDGRLSVPHLGTDAERIRAHELSLLRRYAPRAAAVAS